MKVFLLALLSSLFSLAFAQSPGQIIRGTITDKESKITLPGAAVMVFTDTVYLDATVSDENGNYRIESIPLGRHILKISFIGYLDVVLSDVIVTAGKEVIINAELTASAQMLNEIKVTAYRKGEVINDMASVSVRTFSVDETERYAGSRGDPARMASNFAGVQGADDSRNDIVVRGNSPLGVLWRFEGVDIPNPNHFAIAGTTGGPVSIIDNKYLSNSDFFTGAFPAEYGNSVAAVFDLNMRNGNNETKEYSAQLGFLGTELFAEGPFSGKRRASWLAGFRYSTLQLFNFMHIPIGTQAVPRYMDGAYKINIPYKKSNLSFFGIAGKSNIDILVSEYSKEETELYGDSDRDQYFGTSMAVAGASYGHQISSSAYGKAIAAYSWQENHANHQLVYRDINFAIDSIVPNLNYQYKDQKLSAIYNFYKKIDNRNSFKSGLEAEKIFYNHIDSNLNLYTWQWDDRYNFKGSSYFIQGYFQWKHKVSDNFSLNGGVHGQIFTLNKNSKSVEPRFGLTYNLSPKSSLSFGTGLHSQMLPSYQYTYQKLQPSGEFLLINHDIGFIRSFHAVLGYDRSAGNNFRIKAETYFQYLFDVPVEIHSSAFSLANEGSGFSRFFPDSLENTGTGKNYGVELTLEKFFSNHYFFLITGSLYDSRYTGSDGIERKTDFNGNYVANALAGYEFTISKRNVLTAGGKITYAGGKLATPVDIPATNAAKEIVYIDSLTNTIRLKDYFRLDLKFAYRVNAKHKKITHEISLDIVNILNTKNILGLTYAPDPTNPDASPVKEEYQLGFLPLFYYKINF